MKNTVVQPRTKEHLHSTGDGLGEGEVGGLGGDGAQLLPQRLRHVLGHQRMLRLDLGEVAHLG